MLTMLERLRDAQNAHDAEGFAALFAEDYSSSQPLHGGRAFVGRAQVLKNWTAVFEAVPDFVSELVSYSIAGDTEWGEWHWHGRHLDGSSFAMRGVGIFTIRDGLIAEGRLYIEPVAAGSEDINASVQELYKPPPAETT
jgi:ketosteroid isomerase-like protein